MRLDNKALRDRINGGSSASSPLKVAKDELMRNVERNTGLGFDGDEASFNPRSAGDIVMHESSMLDDEDFARGRIESKKALDPAIQMTVAAVATAVAYHDVKQADADIEWLKTHNHVEEIKDKDGNVVDRHVTDTSIYDYQTQGIRDPNADADLIKASSGQYSHENQDYGKEWGAGGESSPIDFHADRAEGLNPDTTGSPFAHYHDDSVNHTNDDWKGDLGIRYADIDELAAPDGSNVDHLFGGSGEPDAPPVPGGTHTDPGYQPSQGTGSYQSDQYQPADRQPAQNQAMGSASSYTGHQHQDAAVPGSSPVPEMASPSSNGEEYVKLAQEHNNAVQGGGTEPELFSDAGKNASGSFMDDVKKPEENSLFNRQSGISSGQQGDIRQDGIAVGQDIPGLAGGTGGKTRVLDVQLNYTGVTSGNKLDLSSGQALRPDQIHQDKSGRKVAVLSNGKEMDLSKVPVVDGKMIDPTTCRRYKDGDVFTNDFGEKFVKSADGKSTIQLTKLDNKSQEIMFGASNDGFMMEHAGNVNADYMSIHHFSFMERDGNNARVKGIDAKSVSPEFRKFIKNGKIDEKAANAEGFIVAKTVTKINGKERVIGVSFLKNEKGIASKTLRQHRRQINNNVRMGQMYSDAIIGKGFMTPLKVLKRRQKIKGMSEEQKAMYEKGYKSQKRAQNSINRARRSIRRLRNTLVMTYINNPMSEGYGRDTVRAKQTARQMYEGSMTLLRIQGRLLNFAAGEFKKKHGKAIFKRIEGRLTKKIDKAKGRVHQKILEGALKQVQKEMAIGSVNGYLASLAYHGITGITGALSRVPVRIFERVTRGTKAGDLAKGALNKMHAVQNEVDGLNNFGDLGSHILGKQKELLKKGAGKAKGAAKGVANKLGGKLFGKDRWSKFTGGVSKVFKGIQKFNSGVSKLIGKVVGAIREFFATIIHYVALAIMWIAIAILIIILCITIACYFTAIFSPFLGIGDIIKEFFTIHTDTPVETMTPEGQPTVEPLIRILQDKHTEMVSKLNKELQKPDTSQDIVYDNGSKENYKECICALNVIDTQDYQKYGEKQVTKQLDAVYSKSHHMWIEIQHYTITQALYEDKDDPKKITGYKNIDKIRRIVHLNILRDTAVVSLKEAAAAVPNSGGGGEESENIDISNSQWLQICEKVKNACVDQVKIDGNPRHKYQQAYRHIPVTIDGKKYTFDRPDCSGFTSLCLKVAIGWNKADTSSSFNGMNNNKVEGKAWSGSLSEIQPGDILVYSGHVEIYAGLDKAGKPRVYNWGGDDYTKPRSHCTYVHGPTPKSSSSARWRLRLRSKKLLEDDDDKKDNKDDKKKNDDKNNGSNGTDVKGSTKYSWDYLVYNVGMSKYAAAAILGCWKCESGNRPNSYESWYLASWSKANGGTGAYDADMLKPEFIKKKFGTYFEKAEASHSFTSKYTAGTAYYAWKDGYKRPGIGLAGWTGKEPAWGSERLCDYAKSKGKSWQDYGIQLNYFRNECEANGILKGVKNKKTLEDATLYIFGNTEWGHVVHPGEKGYSQFIKRYHSRLDAARDKYREFKDSKQKYTDFSNIPSDAIGDSNSSVYNGPAYTVDYNPINYDSLGNEEGGVKALQNTLDEYVKMAHNGEYKQETMYRCDQEFDHSTKKFKKKTDKSKKWDPKKQHVLGKYGGSKKGKTGYGTGLDFLRCRIYAQHGVTIPWQYDVLKQMPSEKHSSNVKKNGESYSTWNHRKAGDLIIYQPDMNKPLANWNTVVFSYYGTAQQYCVAYLNEDYPGLGKMGDIIKISYKSLKKDHIYKVIRINGITVDKRYLASPYVGFGGFTEDDDLKHMDIKRTLKIKVDDLDPGDGNKSHGMSDVAMFKQMKDNKDLWVDKDDKKKSGKGVTFYPDADYSDPDKVDKGDEEIHLWYEGYFEDDFAKELRKIPDYKDQQKVLDDMIAHGGHVFDFLNEHGFLPSTFVTMAWYTSEQGTNDLLMGYNNPVGLTKWWTKGQSGKYPYSGYVIGESGYLKFSSLEECARAWVMYIQDMTGNTTYDMGWSENDDTLYLPANGGNITLRKLKDRSTKEYAAKAKEKGVKPYEAALKQYLMSVEHMSKDDAEDLLDDLIPMCEKYKIPEYDEWINGYSSDDNKTDNGKDDNKDSGSDQNEDQQMKHDAESLAINEAGTSPIMLDQNGDGKIDISDLPPDVFASDPDIAKEFNKMYGTNYDTGKTYSGCDGSMISLENLQSYLDFVKSGRDYSKLDGYNFRDVSSTASQ